MIHHHLRKVQPAAAEDAKEAKERRGLRASSGGAYCGQLREAGILNAMAGGVGPTACVTPENLETDGPVLGDAAELISRLVRMRRPRSVCAGVVFLSARVLLQQQGRAIVFPMRFRVRVLRVFFGFDGTILPLGPFGFVASTLHCQPPLSKRGIVIGFQLLYGELRRFHRRRCQRFEKSVDHGLINLDTTDVQTVDAASANNILILARTMVSGRRVAACVVSVQPAATLPTRGQACSKAEPSLTAPPAWCASGCTLESIRAWLAWKVGQSM
jgi:hypothetical protein